MKESLVDIGGYSYRYGYDEDSQKTVYLGPVGDAPALSEEQFLFVLQELDFTEEDIKLIEQETAKGLVLNVAESLDTPIRPDDAVDEIIKMGQKGMEFDEDAYAWDIRNHSKHPVPHLTNERYLEWFNKRFKESSSISGKGRVRTTYDVGGWVREDEYSYSGEIDSEIHTWDITLIGVRLEEERETLPSGEKYVSYKVFWDNADVDDLY